MKFLNELLPSITIWVENHTLVLTVSGLISIFLFVGTLLVLPVLIIMIPSDYFVRPREKHLWASHRHSLVRLVLLIVKNVIGLVLVLMGFVMLFIPGQGLLTIFVGLLMLNFPGKRGLELRLVRNENIKEGINWIRRKAGKRPLIEPK